MKNEIDDLMTAGEIDALLIAGPTSHNPAMVYFTGIKPISSTFLIKKVGQAPVLFYLPMERDEAASTGLQTKNIFDYDIYKLLEETGGDQMRMLALQLQRMLQDFDISGRVALYGETEIGSLFASLRLLEQIQPDVEIVGEDTSRSVLGRARTTKDEDEISRIRKMGQVTTNVVSDVAGFLTSHNVKNDLLVDRSGNVLTVGAVKRRINTWLSMRGADNPHGCIFAIGRDAGVPHSSGSDDDPVAVGKSIIFDIYPTEAGGGYYFDFTRTWCLGHAPDDVQAAYEDVLDVYDSVREAMEADAPFRDYQIMACEMFAERGHATIMSDRNTKEGYVHSLGHGLGLDVHEAPNSVHLESNQDRLRPGSVVTIEPGLYYPGRNYGVRIEDTIWVRPDGKMEILADYPKDLVLKMPGI
jgi:Xaa-Pro aminopeptidase